MQKAIVALTVGMTVAISAFAYKKDHDYPKAR